MYGPLDWRECRYNCGFKQYCSPQSLRDHEEDCKERPSEKKKRVMECPKCKTLLVKVGKGYLCTNEACDFEVGIIDGGKLQQ